MATWKGRSRGGVAGYRFFIFLLRYGGLRLSYLFLVFVVPYFFLFAPKARKPIYFYFRNILGYGRWKSVGMVLLNFYRLGQVLLDKVALLAGFSNKFTFDFEGEDHIRQMAKESGGFLIGAHIGNWEIAGQLLDRIGTRVHIIMVEAEHQRIKALLDDVLTKKSLNIITICDDMSHLFKIKEALEKKELLAIHGDRFVEGAKTIPGTLMGHAALLPFGTFYLPVKYNTPVTFVSAVKVTDNHYHFRATKPKNYGAGRDRQLQEIKLKAIVADYLEETGSVLRKHPEQWFNYYYFWGIPNQD